MNIARRIGLCAAAALAASLWSDANAAQAGGAAPAVQETLSQTYRVSRMDDVEYQKSVGPIKVFDNVHYVGPGFVSVWLLQTSDGLILIDTAQEPYVDHVLDNIRKAGFDPRNIRYILISHGHLDHFGGAARIQEISGARVGAIAEDWTAIEATGSRPGRGGAPPPPVPKRDLVIKDGDTLTLGNTTLKFYHTPGHTAGVLSAELTVFDNGRPHKAFFHGGAGARNGLEGARQAVTSADRVAQIQGIEVGLMVHAWMDTNFYPNGSIFERAEILKQRKPGDPNPFVDAASWNTWAKSAQTNAAKAVAEAQAAPPPRQ
jgi:metallo-beta-lactamase class B